MLRTTPQERLALGVTALLLTAGAGVRVLDLRRPGPTWEATKAADTSPDITEVRARADSAAARERARSRPLGDGERLDPNRAGVDELQRLPRVGPSLAARIVAWRGSHGHFHTLADLDSVPGVGPKLLESLAPHLALPPAPPTPAVPPATATATATTPSPAGHAPPGPIDVNRASAEELDALPGVGPALARRIVEWRESHGAFHSAADLEKVQGVGPRLRARLEPLLRLGP